MSWQRHPLHDGLAPWAGEWDRLNRQVYGAHPLFDSRFMSALLRHFGSGSEYLAIHDAGHDPDALASVSAALQRVRPSPPRSRYA
mgnify:CR=1 FL=1